MKVYIKAVSIEDMRKQYSEMPEPNFIELINVDPTADYTSGKRGKFMPWIFKQNKLGNLTTEGDYNEVHDALVTFEKDKKAFPNPDLNSYKTVEDFLHAYHVALNNPSPLSKRQKHRRVKEALSGEATGDIEFLVSDGDWELYTPKTFEGSIALAETGCDKTKPYLYPEADEDNMKAKWCTAASEGWYRSYTNDGPLYIFINRNDPINKWQSCPGAAMNGRSAWFFDKWDKEFGQKEFLRFCGDHPNFKRFFDIQNAAGIIYMGEKCLGFDPNAKEITLPDDFRWGKWSIPQDIETLYIPDSVEIDATSRWNTPSLRYRKSLKTVRLPETLKELPEQFFEDCVSLEEVTIPDSVRRYGARAFEGCSSLRIINHSANLKVVREYCFVHCTSLTSQLPDSVEFIGKGAFADCPSLRNIDMPANMTKISSGLFKKSPSVASVELNNVTSVGSSAFEGSVIQDIDISKLTHIGGSAFRSCDSLQNIEFNSEGVDVGPHAFAEIYGFSGTIIIDDAVTLGISAFDDCPNITIDWMKSDEPYEFEDIELLICSKSCTQLIKANKGYIPIEIREDGTRYEVE